MLQDKKFIIIAFGYFCYVAGVIFFLCGVGFTVLLGYNMFVGNEEKLLTTFMFPIGPILMALGYAVFRLGRNIHNPPEPDIEKIESFDE